MSEINIEKFRSETRKWLEKNCPISMRGKTDDVRDLYWGGVNAKFESKDQKTWFQAMYNKGWIAPRWEIKYGGGGISELENKVLMQEMSRIKCKQPLFSFGLAMLGPALLKYGDDQQKDKYLNQITKGEIKWAQGYSEPNAGSDLAGLQCKAEDNGDHYLINGSKVWTSYGDMGDWIFCLVRTDFDVKKQMGISFILINMRSEGVMTRPIKLISGKSPFTETFFNDVKVPKENLVGELNKGWTIAKYLLTHERQMIGGIGGNDEKFEPREIALEAFNLKNKILPNPILRHELAEYEMDDKVFSMTIERAIDEAKAGNNSGATSSLFKYYGTELNQQRMELIMSLSGCDELIMDSEKNKNGYIASKFLRSKGNTIEGGTSEIQLNIISKNILGLPIK
jgi:acyl-CoA dehydrogenase